MCEWVGKMERNFFFLFFFIFCQKKRRNQVEFKVMQKLEKKDGKTKTFVFLNKLFLKYRKSLVLLAAKVLDKWLVFQ